MIIILSPAKARHLHCPFVVGKCTADDCMAWVPLYPDHPRGALGTCSLISDKESIRAFVGPEIVLDDEDPAVNDKGGANGR